MYTNVLLVSNVKQNALLTYSLHYLKQLYYTLKVNSDTYINEDILEQTVEEWS